MLRSPPGERRNERLTIHGGSWPRLGIRITSWRAVNRTAFQLFDRLCLAFYQSSQPLNLGFHAHVPNLTTWPELSCRNFAGQRSENARIEGKYYELQGSGNKDLNAGESTTLLEARGGIEPPNKGFADLCLTTWLPRQFVALFERYHRCFMPNASGRSAPGKI